MLFSWFPQTSAVIFPKKLRNSSVLYRQTNRVRSVWKIYVYFLKNLCYTILYWFIMRASRGRIVPAALRCAAAAPLLFPLFFPGRCGRACDKRYHCTVRRRRHGTACTMTAPGGHVRQDPYAGSAEKPDHAENGRNLPSGPRCEVRSKNGSPSRLFALRFSAIHFYDLNKKRSKKFWRKK